MILTPVGIVILIAGLAGLSIGNRMTIYTLLCASLLQSAAAALLTAVGGASIQPGHLVLVFLFLLTLIDNELRAKLISSSYETASFIWLSLLTFYSTISAYLFPRLFEGLTYTYSMARSDASSGVPLLPLMPNSGNLTQAVYFIGDYFIFVIFNLTTRSQLNCRIVADGIIVCGWANFLLAIIDVGTGLSGSAWLMEPIRNANYSMLNDNDVMGMKRIVGSFSEASAYAYTTIGLFTFCIELWLRGYRSASTGTVSLLLFCTLIASTSTTAYVGLVLVLVFIVFSSILRYISGGVRANTGVFLAIIPLTSIPFYLAISLNENAVRGLLEIADNMVFNKMTTSSGIERSLWNQQAVTNFFDTALLGAGTGSVKASSLVSALLGNVGLLGTTFFIGFVISLFFDSRYFSSSATAVPIRQACCSASFSLVMTACISGATIDLGILFFVFAGTASAHHKNPATGSENRADSDFKYRSSW